MMGRIIIKNGMVLTLDEAGTYYESGTVIVNGDRLAAILPASQSFECFPTDEVIDASNKIVMPGLIDLHYHTAIGKGFNDHMPLWEYLDECWYPLVRALDPEAAYWAALASYTESIKAGTTTVNDMYRQLDSLAMAAEEIGIRAVLCNDVALKEHHLDCLQDNYDAYQRNHGKANGRIEVRVGIEWLPLASPDLLREARAMADTLGSGIHVHLNESQTEVDFCLEKFGRRPTELAYDMGLLGPDTIAAHCVWLSDGEIAMMAETGTHISHNPNSNAKLGNGIARVPEILAAGINVGLGHDAVECNNSADMFEVMKYASLLQRASRVDASLMPAREVLHMATHHGAKALGHETGQLAVGKKADIILVETNNAIFTPLLRDTPVHLTSHLVFAANGSTVDTVIINGEIVMRGRVLTHVDEQLIISEANAAFRRLKDNIVVMKGND
ncbi:amidohydrolase [Pectobacteriaceae bacterium CE70]|uniref:Chlorohydrolase n=1 Tax=Serratia sp. (strain ATCC 39006) TaxID=104623 RepID=A0A2I5T391_SERS3|nr:MULTISPECIES: amidohydrolase [Enterobacterales]WJV62355.1 amidohydrolase [Pectobacteriaceae bacterium C52]WJV66660.1 amidohydrolase [Pectobacteriaceae bacterium CE70]WJY10657.1 amidohydrolase [Pectobacteriaceae bacterium C80]AUG99029.1 chlorohydrolase [Serratia sp. ATCC 39006]AUH03344.1 chlorohydrolase [Serratia sp. ATCC 39006]